MTRLSAGSRVQLVERLVGLSRCDWKYADLYLNAAQQLLSEDLSLEEYQAQSGGT